MRETDFSSGARIGDVGGVERDSGREGGVIGPSKSDDELELEETDRMELFDDILDSECEYEDAVYAEEPCAVSTAVPPDGMRVRIAAVFFRADDSRRG